MYKPKIYSYYKSLRSLNEEDLGTYNRRYIFTFGQSYNKPLNSYEYLFNSKHSLRVTDKENLNLMVTHYLTDFMYRTPNIFSRKHNPAHADTVVHRLRDYRNDSTKKLKLDTKLFPIIAKLRFGKGGKKAKIFNNVNEFISGGCRLNLKQYTLEEFDKCKYEFRIHMVNPNLVDADKFRTTFLEYKNNFNENILLPSSGVFYIQQKTYDGSRDISNIDIVNRSRDSKVELWSIENIKLEHLDLLNMNVLSKVLNNIRESLKMDILTFDVGITMDNKIIIFESNSCPSVKYVKTKEAYIKLIKSICENKESQLT